jgi:hypothetical protein
MSLRLFLMADYLDGVMITTRGTHDKHCIYHRSEKHHQGESRTDLSESPGHNLHACTDPLIVQLREVGSTVIQWHINSIHQ